RRQQLPGVLIVVATMNIIYLALFTAQFFTGSNALSCYQCQNGNPDLGEYDPDCGQSNYSNNEETTDCEHCKSCWIGVYDNGDVFRSSGGGYDHSDCTTADGYTGCYCTGEKCNKGLCEFCDPDHSTTTIQPSTTTTASPQPTTLSCYSCQNTNPASSFYDEECGNANYNGNKKDCENCKSCWTGVYDSGAVYRSSSNVGEAGDCSTSDGYTACYCADDDCNSELCEYCDPMHTTTPQPTTTPVSGEGVRCYSCLNCPTVDGSTNVIQRPDHNTCSTAIYLTNSMVLRGSSDKSHDNGECIDEGDAFTCFCTGDLCNDDSFNTSILGKDKMIDALKP
ncbi:unnamed protein product, partial [Meganyctiphanes norvegica]